MKKKKRSTKDTIEPLSKNARGKDSRIPKKSIPGGYYMPSISKYHN